MSMPWFCGLCGTVFSQSGECSKDRIALTAKSTMTLVGTVVGNYTLVEFIARGGMGEVYRALHPGIGAQVAVKILNQSAAVDADIAKRLSLEAQICNAIEHPGVVKVFDAGQINKRVYIIMEFCKGKTLEDALESPLARPVALHIVEQVLSILTAAHERNVVHRDVKPSNIFLCNDGSIKLLDFGVARALDKATRLTAQGTMIGTPAYMAPEQINGKPVDQRTDLYSLGVVMYELICGQRPFTGDSTFTILDAHLHRLPAPMFHPLSVEPELQYIVSKALSKDPDQRFCDAATMQKEVVNARSNLLQHTSSSVPDLTKNIPSATNQMTMVMDSTVRTTSVDSSKTAITDPLRTAKVQGMENPPRTNVTMQQTQQLTQVVGERLQLPKVGRKNNRFLWAALGAAVVIVGVSMMAVKYQSARSTSITPEQSAVNEKNRVANTTPISRAAPTNTADKAAIPPTPAPPPPTKTQDSLRVADAKPQTPVTSPVKKAVAPTTKEPTAAETSHKKNEVEVDQPARQGLPQNCLDLKEELVPRMKTCPSVGLEPAEQLENLLEKLARDDKLTTKDLERRCSAAQRQFGSLLAACE
jgi:eukaryotic-like serine/threonine-protein kinase